MSSTATVEARVFTPGMKQPVKHVGVPPVRTLTDTPHDFLSLLTKSRAGVCQDYNVKQVIFSQGDPADHVYYIISGQVKLSVVSAEGKEAVIDILEQGNFFGEECLGNQTVGNHTVRTSMASVAQSASIIQSDKRTVAKIIHEDPVFAKLFTSYLISHNVRLKENLVDQLFNSSQKRLARVLLQLAHLDNGSNSEPVIPWLSQETLAAMVGTTRSRVSYFMNSFRKNGYIDYDSNSDVMRINSKLHKFVYCNGNRMTA